MKLFGYKIEKIREEDIKKTILDKVELNAKHGLISAKIQLKHHNLLLEDAESNNRTEAEIKGYKDAIELDLKTINNWETQLKAVKYERENN